MQSSEIIILRRNNCSIRNMQPREVQNAFFH